MPASSRLLPPNSRLAKLAQSAIRDLKFTNHLPPHQYEHHCLMSQSYEPASWDVGAGLGERRASSTTAEAQPLEFERGTQPRRLMPLLLFLLTCYTTYQVGEHEFKNGIVYAAALLGILRCHEMGHWLQARALSRAGQPALFRPHAIRSDRHDGSGDRHARKHGQPPLAVRHRHQRPAGRPRSGDRLFDRRAATGRRSFRSSRIRRGRLLAHRCLFQLARVRGSSDQRSRARPSICTPSPTPAGWASSSRL